jgi:membrane protease YdiL (CAAX protease family)
MRNFIRRHPTLLYFAVTFAVSWTGVFAVVGPNGFPLAADRAKTLLPLIVIGIVVGPPIASILLTGVGFGRTGLAEVLSRLFTWRVGARWFAFAFLATPVLAGAALFALLPVSSHFMPGILASDDKSAVLFGALAAGLVAGILEEIGWTGFATPRLLPRYGVVKTGLIVGFLWGAWHYIVAVVGSGTESGEFSVDLFLPQILFYVAVLPAYRVLMVWVYDHTRSLLVAMLMHASLTGFVLFILMPLDMEGSPLLAWYAIFAASLWAVVAAIARHANRLIPRAPLIVQPSAAKV